MILIVNVCKERLHYFEFVKPVEDILKSEKVSYEMFHYKQINDRILSRANKIIICGTSLRDNCFLKDIEKFNWIKCFDKPILGICAGFQIIGIVFGGRKKEQLEIGYFYEKFSEEFLGVKGRAEVYHLHKNYILFDDDFKVFCKSKFPQAIKHKDKEIYGVLFHPEVRNREMILKFKSLL